MAGRETGTHSAELNPRGPKFSQAPKSKLLKLRVARLLVNQTDSWGRVRSHKP